MSRFSPELVATRRPAQYTCEAITVRGVCCRLEVSYFRFFSRTVLFCFILPLVPGTDELLRTAYGGFLATANYLQWSSFLLRPSRNTLIKMNHRLHLCSQKDLVPTCTTGEGTARYLIDMHTRPCRKFSGTRFPEFPHVARSQAIARTASYTAVRAVKCLITHVSSQRRIHNNATMLLYWQLGVGVEALFIQRGQWQTV